MVSTWSIRCPAMQLVLICCVLLTFGRDGLTVNAQTPVFTVQPQNVTARLGENVSLRCTVYPPVPVYWIVNGFPLISNTSYDLKFDRVTGEHEITIKNISMQRDGHYFCRSNVQIPNSKVVRSQEAYITIIVPPTQIKLVPFSPVTIAQENVETSLTCSVFGGKPAPSLQWFKDDTQLEAGVDTRMFASDGTKIENVTSTLKWLPMRGDHEKRIYCTASHQALQGGPLRAETQLNVEYPPVVKIVSVPEVVKEGDAVMLQCIVDANPYFDLAFRWTRNGLAVSDSATGILHIESAQRSTDRPVVYTCEASNRIGTNAASFLLDVQYPPVFFSMPEVKAADLKSDVFLTCNVDSNPPAAITWTRADTYPAKVIGTEIVLQFRAASATDFGVYVCQATAGAIFPAVRKEVRVLQKGAPFISAEASVYAGQGETNVQIKCLINGLPVADTVRWISPQGRLVNPQIDDRLEITQDILPDRLVSHLTIRNVKKEDFGLYNCTASNAYGTSDRLIPLKETDWMLPIITGSACGGALLLVIIVVSAILCIRCRSHNRLKEKASDTSGSTTTSDDLDVKSGSGVCGGHHAGPLDMYTNSNETLTDGGGSKKVAWNGTGRRQETLLSHPYTIDSRQNYYTRYADYEQEYNPNSFVGLPAIYTPTLSMGPQDQSRDPSPYHPSGLPNMEPLYGRFLEPAINSRLATNV